MLRYYLALWGILSAFPLQANPLLLKQALQAFEKDDFEQAKNIIDQATSQEAAPGKIWYYRGAIYEKLLRRQIATEKALQLFDETLAAYHQALALTPAPSQYHSYTQINLNNLWAYYLDRGRRYYRQENFDKAIEQWKYCQQIKADALCVALYTAIAAHQNGQYALARQHYNRYLTQTTAAPAAVYRALAHLIVELDKDPKKGLQVVEQALMHDPFAHDLLYEQLALYKTLDQVEALQKQLEEKIAAAPSEAAYYYQLGYWYEQQEKFAEALQQYEQATELAPDNIAPIRQQGIVYYNQAAQLTQTIQEMPDETFQEQGKKLKQQLTDHLEQALSCLEQARQLNPRDIFTLEYLQTLYKRLRKPAQAAHIARQLRKYGLVRE